MIRKNHSLGGGCPDDTKSKHRPSKKIFGIKLKALRRSDKRSVAANHHIATERPVNAEATWCIEKNASKVFSVCYAHDGKIQRRLSSWVVLLSIKI
ncbi:hypothetical protein AVEN_217372-1 [Araneus ventricosus]|uniref:Uncharacterized protein n=1 Tax=Araneus ventricosus TaxID=182803 RepID=A0A4Y2HXT0_ARAVE|nr:hypothetical protein AVEN_217372-1 [Araneus ventricosus]